MLAQNFKTATDLGITEVERQTLIKVMGMFERGEIVPAAARNANSGIPNGFHMATVSEQSACGTVACICGWCQIVSGDPDMFLDGRKPHELMEGLFLWGTALKERVNDPAAAAIAIRSYLTTGDARWDLALAT